MSKRRILFNKLEYDILPTTSQASRCDKGKRTCPQCPCEVENCDHILRCPSPSAAAWRLKFQASLLDFFRETQTASVLTELALSVFDKWFLAEVEFTLNPQEDPAQVARLIEEENAIGWQQLFNGRFSLECGTIQEASYSRAPPIEGQQKRTGLQSQAKLIFKIWEEWESRWSDRNKAPLQS